MIEERRGKIQRRVRNIGKRNVAGQGVGIQEINKKNNNMGYIVGKIIAGKNILRKKICL